MGEARKNTDRNDRLKMLAEDMHRVCRETGAGIGVVPMKDLTEIGLEHLTPRDVGYMGQFLQSETFLSLIIAPSTTSEAVVLGSSKLMEHKANVSGAVAVALAVGPMVHETWQGLCLQTRQLLRHVESIALDDPEDRAWWRATLVSSMERMRLHLESGLDDRRQKHCINPDDDHPLPPFDPDESDEDVRFHAGSAMEPVSRSVN